MLAWIGDESYAGEPCLGGRRHDFGDDLVLRGLVDVQVQLGLRFGACGTREAILQLDAFDTLAIPVGVAFGIDRQRDCLRFLVDGRATRARQLDAYRVREQGGR